jgi:L-lactate dehydrogenase
MATVMRGCASELVLVNRSRDRAKGMATDMGYGAPLSSTTRVTDGDYSDLAGAALVMITVGVNEKSGGATDRSDPQGRLRLLDKNAEVYRQVIPLINAAAPDAVLLVVTDPPDPLAFLTRELVRHERVLSTGTLLDSLRFRVHLGRKLKVALQPSKHRFSVNTERLRSFTGPVPGWAASRFRMRSNSRASCRTKTSARRSSMKCAMRT